MHIFKKLFISIFLLLSFLNSAPPLLAASPACAPGDLKCAFGEVSPPPQVKEFGPGAVGISKFLSNLVSLVYTVAGIVFIFMLLWGSLEWLMSGGEKEKLASAQKRIVTAIIGLILLSVTFAIISIIGIFTGFELFKDVQKQSFNCDSWQRWNPVKQICEP